MEDNPGDVRLTQAVLEEGKVRNHLSVVRDGAEALAFLRQEGQYADALRPDLILLNLRLPGKDGWAVLAELRADDRPNTIPIVILTSSRVEPDLLERYGPHPSCSITKPVDLKQLIAAVQATEQLCFTIVRGPGS